MKNFSIGANINDYFFINVNWTIDLPIPIIKDIRKLTKHDLSPDGKNCLIIKKSIEIGHIFQLEKKYSKNMNFMIQEKNKSRKNIYMGCYGIGITRIIAAIIEQNHDQKGIIWPISIAPFTVAIIPIDYNNIEVRKIS
ncbi:proline--tRNA ligase, partial [Buchnera aphidicola]|nr:proline--tRNA ligase [Buchnera aphidicola]